jgi:hypothetical protein
MIINHIKAEPEGRVMLTGEDERIMMDLVLILSKLGYKVQIADTPSGDFEVTYGYESMWVTECCEEVTSTKLNWPS